MHGVISKFIDIINYDKKSICRVKKHVTRLKVKDTVGETCFNLCHVHNFVLLSGISKIFGINNHLNKTICRLHELCCLHEGQGHT